MNHEVNLPSEIQDGDLLAVGNHWLRGRAIILAREFPPAAADLQGFAEFTWSAGFPIDTAREILRFAIEICVDPTWLARAAITDAWPVAMKDVYSLQAPEPLTGILNAQPNRRQRRARR